MRFVKTEDKQFVRDQLNSAVLNIDSAAYRQFQQERDRALEMQRMSGEVQLLKNELGDIKQLLQHLVNGK